MEIKVSYTEKEIKDLLYKDIKEKFNLVELTEKDVIIQVKSKQNYKAEWETAEFRAEFKKFIT